MRKICHSAKITRSIEHKMYFDTIKYFPVMIQNMYDAVLVVYLQNVFCFSFIPLTVLAPINYNIYIMYK